MAKSIVIALTLLFTGVAVAFGFGTGLEGCSGNCAACHSMKKSEAQAMIGPFGQDVEVLDVKPSIVRGLYQATVRKGKDEGIVYIDYGKRYLINGVVIDAGQKKNITESELLARKRIDVSTIHLENALVLGNPKGSTKLYLFTDPECPYCANLHKEITKMIAQDPQLLVYIILVPLDIHPAAAGKTDTILCTSKRKMADAIRLLERSYNGESIENVSCGSTYATVAQQQARELGIELTPTIVLPDGQVILGMKSADELKTLMLQGTASVGISAAKTN